MALSSTSPGPARARRVALVSAAVAGVSIAAVAGVAWAGGAAAHDRAAAPVTVRATSAAMPEIWAQTDPTARPTVCASFLANPDGTWQVLAAALAREGVTRTEAFDFFTSQCSAEAGVAALRS